MKQEEMFWNKTGIGVIFYKHFDIKNENLKGGDGKIETI